MTTAITTSDLDVEQALELMENGFSKEGAAMAVAESHEGGDDYVEALIALLPPDQWDME